MEIRSTGQGIFIGEKKLIPYAEAIRIPGASAELLEKAIKKGVFKSQIIGKINFIIDEHRLREWIRRRNTNKHDSKPKKLKMLKLISLGRVMKECGVKKETLVKAVKSKQLLIIKRNNKFYVKDEEALYYLSETWQAEGKATKKWRYPGILPHQKESFKIFLSNFGA